MALREIRNLAIVGHSGTGKTTLAEALLYKAGAIKRKGSIAEKNTVSDFDEEEKDRQSSLDASILNFQYGGKHVNLIECPGIPDFIAGPVEGLSAAETALVAVSAAAGIEVMTRKVWGMAEQIGTARILVLTKMDHERAKFDELIEQLKEVFGPTVTPLFYPLGLGSEFKGVINLLGDLAAATGPLEEKVKALANNLIENVVSVDEALMERYLSDEKIPAAELAGCFSKALMARTLTPVICLSSEKDLGIAESLEILTNLTPSPDMIRAKLTKKKGEVVEVKEVEVSEQGPFLARVFKSKRDPFIGKISYLRVYSGTLTTGGTAKSSSASRPDRFSSLLRVQGKETKDVPSASAGEIVAVPKLENLNSGDTVSTEGGDWLFPPMPFPEPMSAMAVTAKARKDEGRISEQLRHLAENDPTFKVEVDPQTKELVIRGLGQLHLDIMLGRLKRQGVEVETRLPKVPYRSTVQGIYEVRYRHKKQTGGAGQFGEVQVKIEPNPGKGFEFVDEVVGGVIPNNLIPSVEKGVRKKMVEGVWPGVPVVDFLIRLNDGKSHPVDSKDIAFQIAGREAFKQAFEKARPVLIEPIVTLEVVIPVRFMGDITGHLSGKRGRILGVDQVGDMQVVKAHVPVSEIQGFGGELKSITGGEGFYSVEFSHYDTVPSHLAQPIIDAAKKNQISEEE